MARKRLTPQRYARWGAGGERMHVVGESSDDTSRCGKPLWGPPILARTVSLDVRCGAAACRRGWPADLQAVS